MGGARASGERRGPGFVKMIDGERSCMQGSESKLALATCACVRGTISSLEKTAFS